MSEYKRKINTISLYIFQHLTEAKCREKDTGKWNRNIEKMYNWCILKIMNTVAHVLQVNKIYRKSKCCCNYVYITPPPPPPPHQDSKMPHEYASDLGLDGGLHWVFQFPQPPRTGQSHVTFDMAGRVMIIRFIINSLNFLVSTSLQTLKIEIA